MDQFLTFTDNQILVHLSFILFSGFCATRMTKRLRLPNVSGYILAGILIGPHCLNVISQDMVEDLSFISDIALACIAFGVGRFFKKETLQNGGKSVIIITCFESLLAGTLVFFGMAFLFHLDIQLSLLLGAIASATAPASTMMTINQYHAKGDFVDTLLQVVALDDVVCLLIFSLASAYVNAMETNALSFTSLLFPILLNLSFIALGAMMGLFLYHMLWPHRSTDNRLILIIAMLLGLSGLCSLVNLSPLLSCMSFGTVYFNASHDQELFKQLNRFTPPIMLLFFVVSGMNLDISMLKSFGFVGIGYFVIRIIGKYLGAYLGCLQVKSKREITSNLGIALIPQAGVAIGLAYLAQRILPTDIGSLLMTIILSSSVLYELIGPACAKFALFRSKAIHIAE